MVHGLIVVLLADRDSICMRSGGWGSRLMHARVFHMLDLTLDASAAPRKQLVDGKKTPLLATAV